MLRYALCLVLTACSTQTPPAPTPPPAPVVPEPPAPPPEPEWESVGLDVPTEVPALAERLTYLETSLRDAELPDDKVESYGHLQQRIYRVLGGNEALATEVRGALDPALHPAFDATLEGTRRSSHTVTRRRSDLPAWDIVTPPPPTELTGLYQEAGEAFEVPWEILAAIHLVETRMGRIRGTSHAGAQGPMQFMPATWAAYGEGDVTDYRDAIRGAAHYLSEMGASRDLNKAIWHYNHSDDYIAAVRSFASLIEADPLAYRGLWGWQVYYQTTAGDIWLDSSYSATERRSIASYCETVAHCPTP